MPIYTFECLKCHETYDGLTPYDEKGKYPKVKCPKCKSKRKSKLFSSEVVPTFSNPKESSKWDSFTYRAGFNMERAKGDRRAAEGASHMGTNPYPHIN